jgi:hypothetical protein
LLKQPRFAVYTLFLIFLFCLSYFVDTIGQ